MDLQTLNLIVSGATLALLTYITGRLRTMSVTAQQAQQDLDNLVAGTLQLLPQVGKTLNDQSTLIAQLRAGQTPSIDPDKVEADVQAIQAQLSALGTAEQNAVAANPPADTPPAAPADAGSTSTPTA